MIKTTYKCDRCGKEDTTNGIDVHRIGIHIDKYTLIDWGDKAINNDWCKSCIEEFFPNYFLRRKSDDDIRAILVKPTIIEQIINFIKR